MRKKELALRLSRRNAALVMSLSAIGIVISGVAAIYMFVLMLGIFKTFTAGVNIFVEYSVLFLISILGTILFTYTFAASWHGEFPPFQLGS